MMRRTVVEQTETQIRWNETVRVRPDKTAALSLLVKVRRPDPRLIACGSVLEVLEKSDGHCLDWSRYYSCPEDPVRWHMATCQGCAREERDSR